MPALVLTDVGDATTFKPLEGVPKDAHQPGVGTAEALPESPPALGTVNFLYPQPSSPVHTKKEDSSYVSISRQLFLIASAEPATRIALARMSPDTTNIASIQQDCQGHIRY